MQHYFNFQLLLAACHILLQPCCCCCVTIYERLLAVMTVISCTAANTTTAAAATTAITACCVCLPHKQPTCALLRRLFCQHQFFTSCQHLWRVLVFVAIASPAVCHMRATHPLRHVGVRAPTLPAALGLVGAGACCCYLRYHDIYCNCVYFVVVACCT